MKKEKNENTSYIFKIKIINDGFFGWKNTKWLIKELIKIYSNKNSFFSKKRIESGVAFIILQWGMIMYFIAKYQTMDIYDLVIWASIEGLISGYTIHEIQKEKSKINLNEKEKESDKPPFE